MNSLDAVINKFVYATFYHIITVGNEYFGTIVLDLCFVCKIVYLAYGSNNIFLGFKTLGRY